MDNNLIINKKILQSLMDHYNLNQAEFAVKTGIHRVNISEIINMKKDLSKNMMSKIKEVFPELSYDYLMTGEGEMLALKTEKSNAIMLPLLSADFAAGPESLFESGDISYEYLQMPVPANLISKLKGVRACTIQAKGDSMEPIINSGDYIIVSEIKPENWQYDLYYDHIYAIATNVGFFVKRLKYNQDDIIMLSDNPKYEPRPVPINRVSAIGKVELVFRVNSLL